MKRLNAIQIMVVFVVLLLPLCAFAGGSGMPWEGPLQSVMDSVTGPVAKIAAVIAICVTGLMLAFGESGSGLNKATQVLFGISIAFAASSFFVGFFGFSGGVAF